MPLQNRVLPTGEIVANSARGTMMGNRGGALHDSRRTLGRRRWVSQRWICCVLDFRQRRRTVMSPGHYTELFFLDEATALAAGHRPCFECRREAAVRFAACWQSARGSELPPTAGEMDRILHGERLEKDGAKRTHRMELSDLPSGAIIAGDAPDTFILVLADSLRGWSPLGYGPRLPRPRRSPVTVLTPPGIIGAMKCGYQPILHETARDPV